MTRRPRRAPPRCRTDARAVGSSQSMRAPRAARVPVEDQQQLRPFGLVPGLEAPGAEQVFRIVAVVVPVDRSSRGRSVPTPGRRPSRPGAASCCRRAAARDRDSARRAGRFECGEQRLAQVHVGVLAAIVAEAPVGIGFVAIQPGGGVPEARFEQRARFRPSTRAASSMPAFSAVAYASSTKARP